MNHLTIAPGETWSTRFIAEMSEFMMVEGTASGAVRWAILDDAERELLSGYAAAGHAAPPFSFGGGVPLRPRMPFFVGFKNESEQTVSVSYRVYGWGWGSQPAQYASGCAPGCLLVALGIAVPVVGWLL